MAEGDTIFKAARTLRAALAGATVLELRSSLPGLLPLACEQVEGGRIAGVEARGKHLLIRFAPSPLVLHTHLGMHGAWHLYGDGERWRQRGDRARIVLRAEADRTWVAVCFAPQLAVLSTAAQVDARLRPLGPDLLAETFDVDVAVGRLLARPGRAVADALLDQQVVAGIGNVYKSEILFLCGIHPEAPVGRLPPTAPAQLLQAGRRLLRRNVAAAAGARVTTESAAGAARHYVYGRARRPCLRCSTPISVRRQGEHARLTYWCARCQPRTAGGWV